METIRVNRILPAFIENEMNWDKVKKYAKKMKDNDELTGDNGFPAILGYYDTINSDDIGKHFNWMVENEEELITKKYIGMQIFRVTDGNHRVCSAQLAGIWALETEEDKSGFVRAS